MSKVQDASGILKVVSALNGEKRSQKVLVENVIFEITTNQGLQGHTVLQKVINREMKPCQLMFLRAKLGSQRQTNF